MSQDNNNRRRTGRQVFDYNNEMSNGRRRAQPSRRPGRGGMQQVLSLGTSSSQRGTVHTSSATRAKAQKKKRRRRRTKITFLVILLAIILVIALVIGWAGCSLCAVYDDVENEPPGEDTKSETIPEYQGKEIICGLICGIDYDNDDATGYASADKVGRTDMILYMMYDTVAGKVSFLQIPRDTYVGPDAETGGMGRINGLYFHAKDTSNRMKALIDVLYDQMGLPTDFYITVDMDAVKELVAVRGTIEVYVPQDVTDPETGNVTLQQGWRHFDADTTEYYLRNRNYGGADIMRLEMQQSFYSALYRDFKELSPLDLVMWMNVLLNHIKIGGLDPMGLGGLAQKALTVSGENITFVRPSVTGGYYNGQQIVSLVPEDLAEILNTYFRPEGYAKSANELNVYTLPMIESIGKVETNIRTMANIQATEPSKPDAA